MWLASKYATKRPSRSRNSLIQAELGPDAQHYKRLTIELADDETNELPSELAIGPDETYLDHYNRLRAAKRAQTDQPLTEAETAARTRGVAGLGGGGEAAEWMKRLVQAPEPAPVVTDLKGMPQRIPGWFTGDSADKSPPGYEVPNPLPRRDPGLAVRPYQVPPRRPTHEEWVRGLAEKGIHLNPDGTRMAPPVRPLPARGHDIWADLIDRKPEYQPRHRAAKVVIAYVTSVLGSDDYVARWYRRHNAMTGLGWEFHESGTGNWYEKEINGKRHRIMGDSSGGVRGWSHHVDGEIPQFYHNIGDAVLHSMRGQGIAGFAVRTKPDAIEDSSYHPDRTESTRPMGRLIPPSTKGKYQTLSTWESGA